MLREFQNREWLGFAGLRPLPHCAWVFHHRACGRTVSYPMRETKSYILVIDHDYFVIVLISLAVVLLLKGNGSQGGLE